MPTGSSVTPPPPDPPVPELPPPPTPPPSAALAAAPRLAPPASGTGTLGKPLFAPPDTAIGLSLDATPLARRVIRPEKASPPGIPAALVRETHRAVATRAGVLRRTTDRPRLDTTVPTRPTFHAMAHIRVVASANFVTGRHATRGRFETTGVRWEDEQSKRVRCAWRCGAATRRRTS